MSKTGVPLKYVKVSSLKKAPFNPKSRQKDINNLTASIEAVGLLYPILVTKDLRVVDGHRRLAACERLGWTDVQVLTVDGDQAELFAEITTSNRPLRGNETLNVYLREPRAIGVKARHKIESCEEIVGRSVIREMAVSGLSMATWDVARRLCLEADQVTPSVQKKVTLWLIKHKCAGSVEKVLRDGGNTSKLMQAVQKNRPITTKMSVVAQ